MKLWEPLKLKPLTKSVVVPEVSVIYILNGWEPLLPTKVYSVPATKASEPSLIKSKLVAPSFVVKE